MLMPIVLSVLICSAASNFIAFPGLDVMLKEEIVMDNRPLIHFNSDAPTQNIPALVKSLGLTTLLQLVVKENLTATLSGKGPFTVFGPNNEAFKKLPDFAKKMINNNTFVTDVLKYHVLAQEVLSNQLKNEETVETFEGKKLRVNIYENTKAVTIQCSKVVAVDKKATNGVVHVLDKVMFPPFGSIGDSIVACPEFSTLVVAVKTAGLLETLQGPGPFTVFAPTDKAFAKIPEDELKKLLANKKELTRVLLYHVISGTFCSAGLSNGESVETLNKSSVKITIAKGGVKVNEAKVVAADATVTNGVVHAIDTVLMPPSDFQPFHPRGILSGLREFN